MLYSRYYGKDGKKSQAINIKQKQEEEIKKSQEVKEEVKEEKPKKKAKKKASEKSE